MGAPNDAELARRLDEETRFFDGLAPEARAAARARVAAGEWPFDPAWSPYRSVLADGEDIAEGGAVAWITDDLSRLLRDRDIELDVALVADPYAAGSNGGYAISVDGHVAWLWRGRGVDSPRWLATVRTAALVNRALDARGIADSVVLGAVGTNAGDAWLVDPAAARLIDEAFGPGAVVVPEDALREAGLPPSA